MALPVIIVDSATGSDTTTSGAGPGDGTTSGSALTGTAAATDAAGTLVTLDGSPSLTNVATDGSHVIFVNAGSAQYFGKITAKDDVAKTVTVATAFAINLTGKTWGIGGKRASVWSANSAKLLNGGDAKPGWVVEMLSGHSESFSGQVTFSASGDTTNGVITLRGRSGAATLPLFTNTANAVGLQMESGSSHQLCSDFEVQNSNATKTASLGFAFNGGTNQVARRIKCAHATNRPWKGFVQRSSSSNTFSILDCEAAHCASHGIDTGNGQSSGSRRYINNYCHDNGGDGIAMNESDASFECRGNICANNTGKGISYANTGGNYTAGSIVSNTCYNNGSDGIITPATATGLSGVLIENNILANNGGYGVNFNGASAILVNTCAIVRNNDLFSNTSGTYSVAITTTGDQTLDPQFTNAGSGDFTIGTNLKALGWPTANVGTYGSTRSYVDIGAVQRQEAGGGGGGGMLVHPGMDGGMRG